MRRFDLAVIGGGPAGAVAAATAARRGASVTLFERGAIGRDRVCGEFVSAEALPLLAELAPRVLADAPEICSVGLISRAGREVRFPLPRSGRGISRLKLDRALWSAALAEGVEGREQTAVLGLEATAGGFRLRLRNGETIEARHAIVAAGRWWRLDGVAASPRMPASSWVGLKARFSGLAGENAVELFSFPGGYAGVTSVEQGWTNVAVLLRSARRGGEGQMLGASRDFAAWLGKVAPQSKLRERLSGGRQCSPTVITAPVAMGRRVAAVGRVLLTGDAGGFIDPFAGDGLARALLSGRLAGELLDQPERYARESQGAAGYRVGAAVRRVITAPEPVQAAVLAAMRHTALGPWLIAATRWRAVQP